METDEILPLVDSRDQVIGTISRNDTDTLTASEGKHIRAVNAFIVRSDDTIWTPIRSLHKKIAPGGLDYSVGAHVQAGESYIEALTREFQEEAGMTITPEQCVEIAYHTPESISPDAIYFNRLYIIRTDEQPRLSNEHTDGSFLPIQDIMARVQSGAVVKGNYLNDLRVLSDYLQGRNKGVS